MAFTIADIKARLHDIAGDSSSGFWNETNQTRAINIARQKMWSQNFYEVVLRVIFDAKVNERSYPMSKAVIPRYSTWDKVEFWQAGFPGAALPASITSVWGEPEWGTVLGGGTTPESVAAEVQPPQNATQTFRYVGPNFWDEHRSRKPVFTLRNDGSVEGNRILLIDQPTWMNVTNGMVFYYFPNPIDMADGDAYSDPLMEAWPLAVDLVAQWAKADLREQEGLYDEAGVAEARGDHLLGMMQTDLPRKTTQKQKQLRMQPKY